MRELTIDFIGDVRRLGETDELVFGREADLVIDDNPYLHRRLGHVFCRRGTWWLRNVGERISLTVLDTQSRSVLTVAAGREVSLSFAHTVVRFEAGRARYEIDVTCPSAGTDRIDRTGYPVDLDDGDLDGATIGFDRLPLTDDQKRLLVVLCEAPLRNPTEEISIPPSKVAARRLNWTLKAYGRRLDNICDRLSQTGVSGLRGDSAGVAKDRRLALAQHALDAQIVSSNDLRLIDT